MPFVTEDTTFEAAGKYGRGKKTAVLNFANPVEPGGGVTRGAMAQEECLCRSSNLYPCLVAKNVYQDYYGYHASLKDRRASDRLIYTKDVCVFKNDEEVPRMMPVSDWFKTDVITCAAPFRPAENGISDDGLRTLMKARITNILEAAVDQEAEVLILGAFGCGAFANPPKIVSEAFREVIFDNAYYKAIPDIIFAIKKSANRNYSVFRECFERNR